MFAGFLFVPEPKRMLMVGLGAGTCPRVMNHYFPEARFEVVDLDEDVVEVAKKYFYFRENPRLNVTVRDGRVHIKALARRKQKYDLVMLDAFRGGYLPYHLTTQEFLEECKQLLTPDGVLVSNLWPSLLLYEYERRTMGRVFAQQYGFGKAGNKIVVCLPRRRQLSRQQLLAIARRITARRKFSFDLEDVVWQMDLRPDYKPRGPILTDDYAPANVLKSIPRE
jgi:spermidine synthase